METEYVWLLKGDNAYKNYISKDWKTIISVKVESGEVYYCLSNGKQFISEEEKVRLIAPICVVNSEYKDCLVIVSGNTNQNFMWKNKRCFSLSDMIVDEFIESTLNFFNGNVVRVSSAAQLASENNILVKSSSIVPVIILTVFFLIFIVFGLYLWLL